MEPVRLGVHFLDSVNASEVSLQLWGVGDACNLDTQSFRAPADPLYPYRSLADRPTSGAVSVDSYRTAQRRNSLKLDVPVVGKIKPAAGRYPVFEGKPENVVNNSVYLVDSGFS